MDVRLEKWQIGQLFKRLFSTKTTWFGQARTFALPRAPKISSMRCDLSQLWPLLSSVSIRFNSSYPPSPINYSIWAVQIVLIALLLPRLSSLQNQSRTRRLLIGPNKSSRIGQTCQQIGLPNSSSSCQPNVVINSCIAVRWAISKYFLKKKNID